jgi:hypothetical protein
VRKMATDDALFEELIEALEELVEFDAADLRRLAGAAADGGPMTPEEFLGSARRLLDAARKAAST